MTAKFTRARVPGISQAALAKAFRAARKVDKTAIVEFDGKTIRIKSASDEETESASKEPAAEKCAG
jgi:hypothetical protein